MARRVDSVLWLLLLLACAGPEPRGEQVTRLPDDLPFDYQLAADSLTRAVPEHDAQTAHSQGDPRYLGIQGYSVVVPGLGERETTFFYDHPDSVRILPRTSDSFMSEAHKAYMSAAALYAQAYNDELQRILSRE